MRNCLLLVLFSFVLLGISGAHATSYTFHSPTDPLTARQSSVYHIAQDKQGFVWFASDTDGLLRYDGYQSINWLSPGEQKAGRLNINRFLRSEKGELWVGSWREGLRYYSADASRVFDFPVLENSPNALSTTRVQTLYKDRLGRIWVGTISGLYYITPDAPLTLHNVAFNAPNHPLYQQRIWGITETADALWFATSKGVVRLDLALDNYSHFYLPGTEDTDIERAKEVRVVEYIHQNLWAGSANGIFLFNPKCDCFGKVDTPPGKPQPRVNALHAGAENTLWVGGADGLYQLNATTLSWTPFNSEYSLLADVDVRSIFLDTAQQLWIGSREQGIFIGTPQSTGFTPLLHQLPFDFKDEGKRLISAIFHADDGSLWLAAQNHLLHRSARNNTWESIELRQQFGIRKIYRITADKTGRLWFATDRGLFNYEAKTLVAITAPFDLAGVRVGGVTDLFISQKGDVYLGLWQHGLIHWDPTQQRATLELPQLSETSGDQIYHISQSDDGQIFAVSRYSGVFSKDSGTAAWQQLPMTNTALVDGYNCALPDGSRLLWLCSEYGLWRYDRESGQLTQYAIKDGLPSIYISAAFFDKDRRLWVMTNYGPARYDAKMQRFISYSTHDGLPDLTMQRNTYSVSQTGEILMGTADGAVFATVAPEQENLIAPKLRLSKLIIDGEDLTRRYPLGTHTIELSSSYKELIIGYALIDYRNASMNTTRSRLVGLSNNWSAFDKHHEVRYVNLPPGNYVLEVDGQNARGIGVESPLKLQIIVNSPWWYSSWLWLAVIVLSFLLALAVMRIQQLNLTYRNKKLQLLVEERTSELKALAVKLQERADHDGLTGLLNRTAFIERFKQQLYDARRLHNPLSLVLIDLDHFKSLNDNHGHNAGDSVLQHFASLLTANVKKTDLTGRWGGEEFVLLLNLDQEGAFTLCEAILAELHTHPFTYQNTVIPYTATFGIARLKLSVTTPDTWVKFADDALYEGKRQGRARVVVATIPEKVS